MTCDGRSVPIDDCSLWVVERGPADGFPVVVVHGGPGLDHHEFGDYLDPLTEDGPVGVHGFCGPTADPIARHRRRGPWSATPRTSSWPR